MGKSYYGSVTDAQRNAPRSHFEDYSKAFEQWFKMERRDGIIELRLHTDGGPAHRIEGGHHPGIWTQAFREVGNDPENQVLILTATGDTWFRESDDYFEHRIEGGSHREDVSDEAKRLMFLGVLRNLYDTIFSLRIPTICAINGPSHMGHMEFGLLMDITLCAPHSTFYDQHFSVANAPPGDGMGLVLQELLGTKRAAYLLYTGNAIDADEAQRLGLVNEVVAGADLLPRAWEIATEIAAMAPGARLMTTQIVRRPWERRLVEDAGFHIAHEFYTLVGPEQLPPSAAERQAAGFADLRDRVTNALNDRGPGS